MKWSVLAIASAVLLAGCVGSGVDDQITKTEVSASVTEPPTQETTTTTAQATTLTLREPDEPLEFTEFETTTACEPTADDSNLQVIQAFVTAYNERDLDTLRELVSESITIADMSGIPHLGEDEWTGVTRWAEAGWNVDDRFELTRLVMYDSGSVFEVDRSNDVLRSNGIDQLHHSWKTHSFNCTISQMVLYLPSDELGPAECRFWEVFSEELAEGTTQDINAPEACSG
ncbi:MAG: hypothetical protein ACLFWH_08015 [Actinomycetota bacterium]